MSRITTCPRCCTRISVPEGITDKTLICLRCLAEVNNPWQGSQVRADDINTEVKRDVNVGCMVLAALIGFCVLGWVLAVSQGESGSTLAGFSCIALVALVGIASIYGLIRWRSSFVGSPFAQNMLGCAVLAVGTLVAIYIFVVISCWNYKVVSH